MARFQGDLPQRTYGFARIIMELVKQMPESTLGWGVGKQLFRCGTGIGANVREADAALTDREFAQFCNIARRETMETVYWLSLVRDTSLVASDQLNAAIVEADELARILTTIVRKTREHLDRVEN
jgi:four helix bundle protein